MDEKKLHSLEFQLKGISGNMRCSCFKIGLLEKQVYQTLASPLKKMFFQNLVIPKILIILVLCNFNFYFKIGAAKTTVKYFAAGDFLEMI